MAAKTGRVRRPNPSTFQPDVPPAAEGPATGGSFMDKKVLGMPMPVALAIGAVIIFLVYRHYQANAASSTSGTSSSSNAPDPNAVDPNTGLTYGAEEQAATAALGGTGTGNGTGAGGAGGGLSVGDLEGLLQSLQGFQGSTNYYYGGGGSGANLTPTNNQPGNGAGSQTPNITLSPTIVIPPGSSGNSKSGNGGGGGTNNNNSAAGPTLDQALGISGGNPIIYNPSVIAASAPAIPELQKAASAVAGTYGTGMSNGTGAVAGTKTATAEKNAYNNPNTKANIH